ncbi:MAG: Uncharacterized protein conserved in bacteria [uncultured Thiotrichaceae bacterium]|uniref:Uncharacterized protein conserved in bacteria n=1 Tax=uncultured Thiotrichaceae bacterium TaxID=298394 RepID=A0A6S6UC67_9GAMM|nr:MAG: Uncharacterized protein conserved in bacteria [uncultured Thiotrichaceae bacterium]
MTTKKDPDATSEFLDAMQGVVPIQHNQVVHDTPKPKAKPMKTIEDEEQVLKDMLSDEFEGLDIQPGDVLSFCADGVQRRIFRKLRRGHYRISDEIDLHGLNAKEAKALLMPYLENVNQLEKCCVRVIHGKGNRSSHKGPVLKRKVDHWLRYHGRVLAFHSALPVDGGTGAIYVLLKRQY